MNVPGLLAERSDFSLAFASYGCRSIAATWFWTCHALSLPVGARIAYSVAICSRHGLSLVGAHLFGPNFPITATGALMNLVGYLMLDYHK